MFEYIAAAQTAIGNRRYRDALTLLHAGINNELASEQPGGSAQLLQHLSTLISYLDFRLGEDFGSKWEVQLNENDLIEFRCSFCGKKEPEVRRIIAGPGVFICDECIQICAHTLAE